MPVGDPGGRPGPFAALAATGGYEDVLARTALRSSGPAGMARFYYYLGRLVERGFVVRSACLDGRLLASLVPVSPAFRLAAARAAPVHRLALSRFAFIRRHEARACLESPRRTLGWSCTIAAWRSWSRP